mmetsp:Transcript_14433/g.29520  ORF Transcript_14433/g.29520 Transcript_14433/m.29520 type:complete len:85 (+) Transcript_14433:1544-1798(+)
MRNFISPDNPLCFAQQLKLIVNSHKTIMKSKLLVALARASCAEVAIIARLAVFTWASGCSVEDHISSMVEDAEPFGTEWVHLIK